MNKKTPSFQESMRFSFITYAIVPTFIFAIFGLVIFLGGWIYSIIYYNRLDNQTILKLLHTEYKLYQQEVQVLEKYFADPENEESLELDRNTESQIYELLYKTGWKGSDGNQVLLLDPQGKVKWEAKEKDMSFVKKEEYLAFGVLNEMRQRPGELVSGVQEGYWCLAKGIYHEEELIGYVVLGLSKTRMNQYIPKLSRQYVITDPYGFIYVGDEEAIQDNLGRFDLRDKQGYLTYASKQFYLSMGAFKNGNLVAYTFTDTVAITQVGSWMVIIILMMFVFIIGVTYFTTKKASNKYTRDVNAIAKAFVQVENGEWDVRLESNSTEEFVTIGKAFNKMTDSMKRQMEENKELATHAAFAQVQQLESQFNPHFLFNTLDNIRFMTRIDPASADKMILSLSMLLRYSIQDSGEEISVGEDIKNLQSYLHILQIRFNKRFSYQIDMEDEIEECMIPKLIIQPLIENAVKYGFKDKDRLNVKVKGYRKNDQLIFSCEDDGAGMSASQLAEIRDRLKQKENKEGHIGLYNIHRRIQLMYGEQYGIFIESKEGEGVQVVIVVPLKKKNAKE